MSPTLPDRDDEQRLAFSIAGVPFRLRAGGAGRLSLPEPYAGFISRRDHSSPFGDYSISFDPDTPLCEPDPSALTWDCESWRMGPCDPSGRISIQICNVPAQAWITVANVAHDFSEGTICPRSRTLGKMAPEALHYPYDQTILLNRLLHANAAVLHGSGVAFENDGLLFFGASGAGKTTFGRMCRQQGATLLNDERSVVRMIDGKPSLSGSPWHGEEVEVNPGTAALRAVFFLRQAKTNRLEEVTGSASVSRLLSCAVAPFYSREGMERALSLWIAVADSVPVYDFHFSLDDEAVGMALHAARAAAS